MMIVMNAENKAAMSCGFVNHRTGLGVGGTEGRISPTVQEDDSAQSSDITSLCSVQNKTILL